MKALLAALQNQDEDIQERVFNVMKALGSEMIIKYMQKTNNFNLNFYLKLVSLDKFLLLREINQKIQLINIDSEEQQELLIPVLSKLGTMHANFKLLSSVYTAAVNKDFIS